MLHEHRQARKGGRNERTTPFAQNLDVHDTARYEPVNTFIAKVRSSVMAAVLTCKAPRLGFT